jgi:polar amino acid transport system permease protein
MTSEDLPSDDLLLSARLVPARRPGRWVAAAALVVLSAMLAHTLVANPRFQWPVVRGYFLPGAILRGLELTVWLTAAVLATGRRCPTPSTSSSPTATTPRSSPRGG